MKNEEILKKSRKENNGQDLYEKEVMKTGGEAGFYTVWIFAAVFALLQMLLCREWNYAVFVLAGGFSATVYTVKARRQKQSQDVKKAAGWWACTALCSVLHFCQMFGVLS